MGVSLGLLTEYSKVYPELNESIERLSVGISKEFILKVGSTFLVDQTMDDLSAHWLDVANLWFGPGNLSFKNDFIKRVRLNYKSEVTTELMILSPITSLKLLQLGFSKKDDKIEKVGDQQEIDLFKIYLLLNDSITKLQTQSTAYIKSKYPNITVGLLLLNIGLSTSDLTNFIYSREFYCQTVKGMFLADFIYNQERLKNHIDKFHDMLGVNSLEDYHSRMLGLLRPIANKKKNGFVELTVTNERDLDFISKITVQDYFAGEDIDFRLVRANPLVEVGKNRYRITHPLFFTDKLYKGLYFVLNRVNDELDAKLKLPSFRTFYTSEFSEKYLLYQVLAYCLRNRYVQFNGAYLDSIGITGAPDYYIRNGRHIFLIENKDILIKAEVKETPLFSDIESELKKKFLEESGRGVGIKQIVKNVKRVLTQQNLFDTDYKSKNAVIYPILIVHDIVYDVPGINHLFNEWFNNELYSVKAKGLDIRNVKPLIVLNIDTLIRVAEALRIRRFSLNDLLEVYYNSIKEKGKMHASPSKVKQSFTDVYLPSTKVIENWISKNHEHIVKENRIMDFAFSRMKGEKL